MSRYKRGLNIWDALEEDNLEMVAFVDHPIVRVRLVLAVATKHGTKEDGETLQLSQATFTQLTVKWGRKSTYIRLEMIVAPLRGLGFVDCEIVSNLSP